MVVKGFLWLKGRKIISLWLRFPSTSGSPWWLTVLTAPLKLAWPSIFLSLSWPGHLYFYYSFPTRQTYNDHLVTLWSTLTSVRPGTTSRLLRDVPTCTTPTSSPTTMTPLRTPFLSPTLLLSSSSSSGMRCVICLIDGAPLCPSSPCRFIIDFTYPEISHLYFLDGMEKRVCGALFRLWE